MRAVQLGEVSAVSAGQGAPQNREAFGHEGHPFIRAASLDALCEGDSFNSLERIDEHAAKEHRLRLYAPGTVVFAKSGMSATKNRIYRLSRPAYVVNHLAAVTPSKELDSIFLRYWLEYFNPTRLIQDSAYPSISQEDIESVSLPLPDLSEQKRIAGVLEQADRMRRTRRYALELSDTFLPAAFVELFGDPSANPKGFSRDTIDTACEKLIDYRGRTPAYSEVGIPHVTAACIKEREIKWQEAKRVSEQTFAEYMTRGLPRVDDVLLTTEAPLGETAVVRTRKKFSLAQRLILLRPSSRLMPDYLCHLLGHAQFRNELLRFATGSTVKGISSENLQSILIPIPPMKVQERFASLVALHESLRAGQREALRQVNHVFQSLLHHAFA